PPGDHMDIPKLQPGCPWYELSSFALPNVKWCEASQCSWITEPANTWSNLGYVGIGIALMLLGARSGNRLMRAFGLAELVVGVSSFVYHASYTFVLQVLDFAAMYVFCALLLIFNLRRLALLGAKQQWRVYAAAVGGLTALTLLFRFLSLPIQPIVAFCVVGMLVTEAMIFARRTAPIRYGYFFLSLGLLITGATFSALDASRVFCDPDNHFVQGHAIWHVLTSLSLLASYRFYAPFAPLLMGEDPATAGAPALAA
ncbi:MAG: ceramidase domain-containing protein, partial [Myxococcales bacterium]